MNQDESQKCISVAKQAIEAKDWAKAERFLGKSLRLHDTEEAQTLLKLVRVNLNSASSGKPQQAGDQQSTKSTASGTSHGNKEQPQEPPNYSKEDVERCKVILAKKEYYDILGLTKPSNENEIKKAYKKLALKFHPDKNRAPQATDAFKKVSQAFACLNNPEKKKIYDEHGTEDDFRSRYSSQFREDEFDPDDIFRMFFGGGLFDPHQRRQYHYQAQRRQQQHHHPGHQQQAQQPQNPAAMLLFQLGPLLLILFLSVLMNFASNTNDVSYNFSYQQNAFHPVQVVSYRLKQPYFVGERTAWELRADMNRKYKLDEKVEQDLLRRTESTCEEAKRVRQQYINLSKRYSSDTDQYELYINKAEQVDLNSCSNLKEFRKVLKTYS